ncbi:MAG: aliphatic sulfonate ABC transporter substrate-binding protein [Thermomicrobiales bacterium]|nr:aliphatic sulfonate ABC transporter substrate-binding protein [Thermomicrobiales bacterium]
MTLSRRRILAAAAATPFALGHGARSRRAAARSAPDQIRLDYAYYSPTSLALRRFGWLEETLAPQNIGVAWVLSAGSNKANEYLRSDAIDFGSTAGSAALLARANGSPIKTVYLYSKPEWSALVVGKDSPLNDVAAIAGKKIAATKGTDPYFFLLRSLDAFGLSSHDVEVINLQHADGRVALERGQVDAWSGLDPHMAASELDNGSRLIYRNIDFNTYGFLNAREAFIDAYPELTQTVLAAYERARRWTLANPEEAVAILAEESRLKPEVAAKVLTERTVLDLNPTPGPDQTAALEAVIPIFQTENQVKPGVDVAAVLADLYAPQFIAAVLAETSAS